MNYQSLYFLIEAELVSVAPESRFYIQSSILYIDQSNIIQ